MNSSTPPTAFTTQFTSVSVTRPPNHPYSGTMVRTSPIQENLRQVDPVITTEGSPIRVTCRTRSGTNSPFIKPQSSDDFHLDLQRQHSNLDSGYNSCSSRNSTPTQRYQMVFPPTTEAGNQYPQEYNGGGGGNSPSHVQSRSGDPQPLYTPELQQAQYQQPPQPQPQQQQQPYQQVEEAELPAQVVHRALNGRCRFIQFPSNLASAPAPKKSEPGSNSQNAVFIGQVRLETTAAELIWLVHRICGACVTHLEGRGTGCYLLYCRNTSDLQLVRTLHKRVLFDVDGVWLARTPEEVDALCEYVALEAALLSRNARLPRDSMVVEEYKPEPRRDHAQNHRQQAGHHQGPPPQYSYAVLSNTNAPGSYPHPGMAPGAQYPYPLYGVSPAQNNLPGGMNNMFM